jgi:hypothetical protein
MNFLRQTSLDRDIRGVAFVFEHTPYNILFTESVGGGPSILAVLYSVMLADLSSSSIVKDKGRRVRSYVDIMKEFIGETVDPRKNNFEVKVFEK